LLAVVVAAASLVLAAHPAGAQVSGGCTATIAGKDVKTADDPSRAIEVDAAATVPVAGTDPQGTAASKVDLEFSPLSWNVADKASNPPSTTWANDVKVSDVAKYGVGLYKVVARTDHCTGTVWVKVTGKSAFTTIAGIIATVMLALGAVLLVLAFVGGLRSGGGLLAALIGGLLAGLGGAVLVQQLALAPLSLVSLIGAVVGAIVIGVLLKVLGSLLHGRSAAPAV
jgi:hypothetical protein